MTDKEKLIKMLDLTIEDNLNRKGDIRLFLQYKAFGAICYAYDLDIITYEEHDELIEKYFHIETYL